MKKTRVKATNTKMVPLSEAMDAISLFCHKVVFGNPKTRKVLLDAVARNSKEDGTYADEIADAVITLVYQDESFRDKCRTDLCDNATAIDVLNAACEIREILNLDDLTLLVDKVLEIQDLESDVKLLLYPAN